MSNISLSKQSLDKLKCSWCGGYLSVAPINFSEDKFTCGRCTTTGLRNLIYEELAKQTIFPCVYQNCTEKLSWGEAKQHEEHCHHKTILCPVYNCLIKYELRTIHQHFNEWHIQFVMDNSGQVMKILTKMSQKYDNSVFLMQCEGVQFLIFVHSKVISYPEDQNVIAGYDYYFGVFSITKTSYDFKYSVAIIDLIHDLPPIEQDQNVETFDDKVHCLKCFEATCTLKYHKKSQTFLPCKVYILNLDDTHLAYYITVHDMKPTVEKQPSAESPSREHGDIAVKLECPICKDYMTPPIYNCTKGHTLCKDCKRKIIQCPFCKAEFGDSRNFILEEISETMKTACVNSSKGCRFSGSIVSTKDHEKYCLYISI